jgi:hypothetical protein
MTVVALTELEESRGCLDLGYRSVHELARKEAGWSRRQVCYLLQVGRKLRELRKVDGLLRDGTLCWSKVRLIVSVATLATEADWIRKAQNSTTDQLEHQVQAIREPRLREHRVLLPSVTLRVHRKYAELLKELRAQTGRPELDDETGFEELLDLAARALGRDDVVQRSAGEEPRPRPNASPHRHLQRPPCRQGLATPAPSTSVLPSWRERPNPPTPFRTPTSTPSRSLGACPGATSKPFCAGPVMRASSVATPSPSTSSTIAWPMNGAAPATPGTSLCAADGAMQQLTNSSGAAGSTPAPPEH